MLDRSLSGFLARLAQGSGSRIIVTPRERNQAAEVELYFAGCGVAAGRRIRARVKAKTSDLKFMLTAVAFRKVLEETEKTSFLR